MLEHENDIIMIDDTDGITPDLTKDYVQAVRKALENDHVDVVHDLTLALHPADISDLLEYLEREERGQLIKAIGNDLTGEILTELEPKIRDHVLTLLESSVIAKLVSDIDISDAVYVLENIPPIKLQEILSHISGVHRMAVEQAFLYPEESVARIMRRDFISLPALWTVSQTLDFFMAGHDLPEKFYDIYVVNQSYKPVGVLSLGNLLKSGKETRLEDIADTDFNPVSIDDNKVDVAYQFEHYRLNSVPVIGRGGRIIGTVLVDDAVEIIQTDAENDIKQLAGVGGEEMADSAFDIVKRRSYWLGINLITAILAGIIIGFFGETIEKYVVLAAMGPLVASMGGNAGSQTLTLAVRALATKTLNETNMRKTIFKELSVGLMNGVIFAIVAAAFVVGGALLDLWALDYKLCLIMAAAMLLELISASMAGILIPLGLQKLKIDPAVSAVVFVTTVTDVVGFFAVLGLACWLLQ